jgi:hypothetical protein
VFVVKINSDKDLFKHILETLLVSRTHIKVGLSESCHILILQGLSSLISKLSFPVGEFDSIPDQSCLVHFDEILEGKSANFIFVLIWIL